ncbi:hypothetical protein ACF09Y_26650 [Streptomyces massasporeus]|uniref:hypothetical protein n=1 Tax=Streptomyces massasporeus TaxID=67324 RepID=UPI0036F701C2
MEYATEPWCWGGGGNYGVNDDYKKFTEDHRVDPNTENYDAGKDSAEAASLFNLAGAARWFLKHLFTWMAEQTEIRSDEGEEVRTEARMPPKTGREWQGPAEAQ